MAEIRVEKKSGTAWIWWLLGALVVALLIWAVVEAMDRDEREVAEVPVVTEPQVPEPLGIPAPAGIPAGLIVASPQEWEGRTVTGEVRVTEVVSDRGFWVEADGQRLFVLLNEVPGEIKEINAGQTILMMNATVHAAGADASELPGELDQQAQRIASGQAVVLAVDSKDVDILSTQAGMS